MNGHVGGEAHSRYLMELSFLLQVRAYLIWVPAMAKPFAY